jgi:hypothetical protein
MVIREVGGSSLIAVIGCMHSGLSLSIVISLTAALLILMTGAFYCRRMKKTFVDEGCRKDEG